MSSQHNAEGGLTSALAELRGLVDQLIDDQIARLGVPLEEPSPRPMSLRASGGPLSVFDPSWEQGRHSVLPLVATVLKTKPPARASVGAQPTKRSTHRASAQESTAETPAERDGHDPRERLDALARHLNDRIRRARDSFSEKPKPEAQS